MSNSKNRNILKGKRLITIGIFSAAYFVVNFVFILIVLFAASIDAGEANIQEVLEQFDLLALKDRHPMSLSGGQKQRLAVVAALLSKKRVLIFDVNWCKGYGCV